MPINKDLKQQKQTKMYFEKFAPQWSKSAKDDEMDFYNVLKIRAEYVIFNTL